MGLLELALAMVQQEIGSPSVLFSVETSNLSNWIVSIATYGTYGVQNGTKNLHHDHNASFLDSCDI